MKRRLLSAFLAVMMVLTMAPVAFAVDEGDTLQSKINNASDTVVLDKNYTESITIPADKTVTLDLNGKTLTNTTGHTITVEQGATLTINGKGTVDNVTHGTAALYNKGTVTVNGGTFDRSKENGKTKENSGNNSWYTIKNVGTMTINDGVTVQTAGNNTALGKFSSLVSNGYFDSGDYTANKGIDQPTLTINGGMFCGGLNTIKNDDRAKIMIVDGTFTNYYQAVVQNHNIAEIKGGTFIAASDANSETYGIYNCGCDANIDLGTLTVSGGTFTGATYAVADVSSAKAVVTISNGQFAGTKAAIIKSSSSNANISISGGVFTSDPSDYCTEGLTGVASGNADYPYTVGEKNAEAKPTKVESASVAPSVAETATAEAKKAAADMHGGDIEGEALKAATKNVANNNMIDANTTVEGNTTVLDALKTATDNNAIDASDVKVVYQTYMDIEVTGAVESKADENGDTTFTELTVNLTPMYRVIATNVDKNYVVDTDKEANKTVNAVQIGNAQKLNLSDGQYTVELQLPAGFAVADQKLSIKHSKDSGDEYYTGTVKKNGQDTTLTFTTNGFSPFTIYANVAAYIGETAYPTLQAAVENVKNDQTITLAQDVAASDVATVTVTANKTFKVDTTKDSSTYDFDAEKNIAAGSRTSIATPTQEGNVYTYVCTYNKPSSGSSGGSSSGKTTYKVTTSAVNNGGVNASPSTAEKGDTITITLSPDKGYTLGKLTVTDGSGKTVSTVKKSDTVYTFTMPASAVTVGVSYVKADETPSKTGYSDVSANDWFASAVDYVTDKGMMNGTSATTFGPKANTTRGMVVTVLYRLENEPSTAAASFTDVASGAYYANAVAWANANGVVSGYGNGKFGPNDKVTREQLAAILYRYAQYKKYDVSVGEDTNIMDFDDVRQISSYAVPAIQWACGAGVMSGKSTYTLDPKGDATRAEVAAMLMRFCENVK